MRGCSDVVEVHQQWHHAHIAAFKDRACHPNDLQLYGRYLLMKVYYKTVGTWALR